MTEQKRFSIIVDPNGNPWGPFEHGAKAVEWAEKKWPGQGAEQPAGDGWELFALHDPDE